MKRKTSLLEIQIVLGGAHNRSRSLTTRQSKENKLPLSILTSPLRKKVKQSAYFNVSRKGQTKAGRRGSCLQQAGQDGCDCLKWAHTHIYNIMHTTTTTTAAATTTTTIPTRITKKPPQQHSILTCRLT